MAGRASTREQTVGVNGASVSFWCRTDGGPSLPMRLAPVTSGLAAHGHRFPVHLLATGLVFGSKQLGEPRRNGALGPCLRYQNEPQPGGNPSELRRSYVVAGSRLPGGWRGWRRILGSSEAPPARLAEAIALAEPQASHRAHPEHDGATTGIPVAERPVAHNEVPRAVRVLDRERGPPPAGARRRRPPVRPGPRPRRQTLPRRGRCALSSARTTRSRPGSWPFAPQARW